MSPAMGRGAAAAAGAVVEPIILVDQKADTTAGGTFTSGAWQVRTLNTEYADPGGYASISSNQFTLQPGKYLIKWFAPAYSCGGHQSRLYDVTGTAVEKYGMSMNASNAYNGYNVSTGSAYVDISSANTYQIEHRCATTQATNGFGWPGSFGGVEVYTRVEAYRLDDAS